jgi:hypothetical protein
MVAEAAVQVAEVAMEVEAEAAEAETVCNDGTQLAMMVNSWQQ